MKPLNLSLLLYVKEPFSVKAGTFDALYSQIAGEIKKLLESEKIRLSLYLPGHVAKVWGKRNISDVVQMRSAIRDGKLELLGGGFYDPMLPLFPIRLQNLQLKKHIALIEKLFKAEPVGYFNSSMAWEIGMTEVLAKHGLRYTLVSERGLQESLGRATRVTGWFTAEDRDSVMQLFPVAKDVGEALLLDAAALQIKMETLGNNNAPWVSVLQIPTNDATSIEFFFKRLRENLQSVSLSMWPISHWLNESSAGKVNLMSDIGENVGLPAGSHSCRELLLRRPESDLMHKSLLIANTHAESLLQGNDLLAVESKLLPLMAPEYYADLYEDNGVRSPLVRWNGNRMVIAVEETIEKAAKIKGRRVEISDFMRTGNRQILVNNSALQFLLSQRSGGSLRTLIYKPAKVNLVSAFQQNGDVPRAFVDHLLSPSLSDEKQIELALNDGLGLLMDPYDYQVERKDDSLSVWMRSEQMANVLGQNHVLHIDKKFTLLKSDSQLDVSYSISNGTFAELNGYFGTELNLGVRKINQDRAYSLKIDGKSIPMNSMLPLLYSDASEIMVKDGILSHAFRYRFSKPAKILLSWILGSHETAAPTEVQGIRIFIFWNLTLSTQTEENLNIHLDFSKRGFFA